MDDYLALLTTTRSPSQSPASPEMQECKLSARHHHHHHRKRRSKIVIGSSKDSPLRSQTASRHNAHGAFRSVAVLGEVVRLETDANQNKMQPEEAFALLRRLLSPSDLAIWEEVDSGQPISLSKLLDGVEAACWRTLSAEQEYNEDSSGELMSTMAIGGGGASPRSLRCQVHRAHNLDSSRKDSHLYEPDSSLDGATGPVRLRYSQLHRGVQIAIIEKQRVLESLRHQLQRAVQHNNELPGAIKDREAKIQKLKETFMVGASKKLDCDDISPTTTANMAKQDTSAMAAAVEDKVQTLRRRRDLRAWACNELRSAINDHMARASELKKEISAIVTEVKKEEMAHKLKAKHVEAIIASTSSTKASAALAVSAAGGGDDPSIRRLSPEDVVTQAREKKEKLLDAIEQRKIHLRARTEVFDARNEVGVLEQKRAEVAARTAVLEQEITHIQRACTPRPEWTQLLNAALVTTAIDRAGKKAKLRMESSRKKLMGGKAKQDDNDDQEGNGDKQLKQILTSNWSTIEKVHAMSEELTRIRTKYHAGDTIIVEQAKLDHLQKEIVKALQQLEATKAKAPAEQGKEAKQ